jgi:hypothetical protein
MATRKTSSRAARPAKRERPEITELRRIFPKGATVFAIVRYVKGSSSLETSLLAIRQGKPTYVTETAAVILDLETSPFSRLIRGSDDFTLREAVKRLAKELHGAPDALRYQWL